MTPYKPDCLAVRMRVDGLGTGAALAQQSPVTISFAWYGDPAITKDYETLVARFEELNPDVRVEMLRWGGRPMQRRNLSSRSQLALHRMCS